MTDTKDIVNDTEKKPLTIGELMKSKERQIAAALPKHLTSEKMMRIALTEINRNPALKKCTASSLIGSIIQASQLGLVPDSILGEAYLIPYKNNKKNVTECQFMAGYQGLMRLAYQSNAIKNIFAKEVCENDSFKFQWGSEPTLHHTFDRNIDRGVASCYYAIAYLTNGGVQFEVMSKEDVDKHKTMSKTGGTTYSPWNTSYDEMAKKTAIRKLLKYLPKSSEDMTLARLVNLDEQGDLGLQNMGDIIEGESAEEEESPSEKPQKTKSDLAAEFFDGTN